MPLSRAVMSLGFSIDTNEIALQCQPLGLFTLLQRPTTRLPDRKLRGSYRKHTRQLGSVYPAADNHNGIALQEAERLVQEAHKTAGEGWRGPTVDKELARSVEFYQSSIGDAIEKANADNARIYFQRIPNSVPEVQAAIMVTSTTPPGVALAAVACHCWAVQACNVL